MMATGNSSRQPYGIDEGLLECNICLFEIKQPKALPCLHTYCLECLQKYVKKEGGTQIKCPVCNEKSTLPQGGVKDLKTNFLINKLKERKSVYDKLHTPKIPCTNCEKPHSEAISRCLECRDFLCVKCLDAHGLMRWSKGHKVCSLEEARSGKVDIFDTTQQNEETCDKHKGQILWFFCKTCWVPVCRDCTVIDHCRPDHEPVSLDEIYQNQKDEIEELATACQQIALEVNTAIEKADRIQCTLDEAAKVAQEQVDKAAEQTLAYFKLQLKVKSQKPKEEIEQWKLSRSQEIQIKKKGLQYQQARLHNAIEFANQAISMESKIDVAHMYSELTTSLNQLRELKPATIQSSASKVKFTPTENCKTMATNLGEVSLGLKAGYWELEKQMTISNGPGASSAANDVTLCSNGDIVLAADSKPSIKACDNNYNFKMAITSTSKCHNVVAMPNGNICTSDWTKYVKVFGKDEKQLFKFSTPPPAVSCDKMTASSSGEACIAGLAVNSRGQLLIGDVNHNIVSRHQQNGDFISKFEVLVEPRYIAVAGTSSSASLDPADHEDRIIVSSSKEHTVLIIDVVGQMRYLPRPHGVEERNWEPTGVCFSEGTIFVSNNAQGEDVDLQGFFDNSGFAVYCYSDSGEYLKAVTTHVTHPKGLALKENGEELLVADDTGVKVFHLK